ncbi:alpha-galactosidase [Pontiella sp.]|uniref:alpha-galactosidase n=1 Tax=Pontiella sp. TaxID=2837462 RepID=UPI003565E5D9
MLSASHGEAFQTLAKTFGPASVKAAGDELVVSSGPVERRWAWTGRGLSTCGLRDLRSGNEWIEQAGDPRADWDFPGLTEGDAKVLSLTARESDDEGFTTRHLEVVAEIEYPQTGVALKYVVWAYPDAPGLRSQIWLKGAPKSGAAATAAGNGVSIGVVSGKAHQIPAKMPEIALVPAYQTSNLYHGKEVELKIEGMNHDRDYRAMLTWWDTGNSGRRTQSVSVLSMDAESAVQVVPPTVLPSRRDDLLPAEVGFDIPAEVRVGDMVRVKVKREAGVNAHLFEFWVFEEGAAPAGLSLNGDPQRIAELKKNAPDGYHLAAYLDCGGMAAARPRPLAGTGNRVDCLPVDGCKLTAFGYYNDTQHRHTPEHHLYREEVLKDSSVDWASVLFAEKEQGGGIAWVKESHKCVNRAGVDTGAFISDAAGLHNTGSALSAADLQPNEYRWCWATWTVLYPENTQWSRELAMKQFDRARFPVDPDRDVFVKANTWGSGNSGDESMAMAAEKEVLKEIDSAANLGIDVLQIDDGWQCGRQKPPNKARAWQVREDWYPNGWATVREAALKKKLKLGLWTAAYAELDDLKRNYDDGGFVTWKYDFASMGNYNHLYAHWSKLRAFLLYTGHRARMAVDVTENAPRFGYFWARDFGCVWLSNRKPENPPNTIPKPTLMLRENRELARYVNLNKFELPIQNFQRVNKTASDAHLYGHAYEVALGLMGIPTFFQTTYYYDAAARTEIRELLNVYKQQRQALYNRYVFAIGDEPDGAAWSGFQWVDPGADEGYLLVFRERQSPERTKRLALRFVDAGEPLRVANLRTGKTGNVVADGDGTVGFRIDDAADFLFLKYQRNGPGQ